MPVLIGAEADALALASELERRGFLVPAIRPPTVPQGSSRLRLSLSAAHQSQDFDALIANFAEFPPTSAAKYSEARRREAVFVPAGLGPEMWDFCAPKLGAFQQFRVDPAIWAPAAAGAVARRHPGRPLGRPFVGVRRRRDWAAVVAINSFDRFVKDGDGCGCVTPAALRAMERALARDPDACIGAFRAWIGAPRPGPVRTAPLAEGLALLRDFDAAPVLAQKTLVLAAEDDALAPPSASRRLAAASGGKLALCARGGHGLPWTAAEFCAEAILGFLREL